MPTTTWRSAEGEIPTMPSPPNSVLRALGGQWWAQSSQCEAMTLDNRELASAIWLAIFVLAALSLPSVRKHLKPLLSLFFSPHILVPVALMVAYVALMLAGLDRLSLWDISQAKDAVVWFCTFAFVTLFEVQSLRLNPQHLKKMVRDVIGIGVLLEFFMNAGVMCFPLEFLLVPVLTILAMLMVVVERNGQYAPVKKLLDVISAAIGIGLFLFVLSRVVHNLQQLVSADTLRALVLPPVLSLLYMPFIYALALYASYDSVKAGLEFTHPGRFRLHPPLLCKAACS
jgi:hypothetical protein